MTTELAWPATRWTLPAAETVALLAAPRHPDGTEVARRMLMELTARRAVRVVRTRRRGWVRGRREVAAFVDGSGGPPASGLLAGAWRVYREAGAETFADGARGVDVRRLVRLLWDRYGSADGLGRAASEALVARRLATVVETRRYGIGRHRTFPLTPAGEQAAADLGRWLEVGRERHEAWTAGGAEGDAAEAVAFAARAGAAVLLLDELLPDLALVSASLRRDQGGGGEGGGGEGGEWPDDDGDDLGLDLDLDLAELGDLGDLSRWTPSGSASTEVAAGMVAAVAEATAAAERAEPSPSP